MCMVYYLCSSKDGLPRYVGQTTTTLAMRRRRHLAAAASGVKTPVYRWIRACLEAGEQIEIVVIDERAIWDETERQVIAQWRRDGVNLLNVLDGGNDTLKKYIARQRDSVERKKKKTIDIPEQTVSPVVPAKKRRKKRRRKGADQTSVGLTKGENRRTWMYGKLGPASEVRHIPIPKPEPKK